MQCSDYFGILLLIIIVSIPSLDDVVDLPSLDDVVKIPSLDDVVLIPSFDDVVKVPSLDDVGSSILLSCIYADAVFSWFNKFN